MEQQHCCQAARRESGEQKVNYRMFYHLVRLYSVGKISRGRFELEWGMEQRQQGIATGLWRRQ